MTETEKAGYYRAKCLGCHAPMAERHHPEQPDCTICHMPRSDSADISHTEVTDHRIVRTPRHTDPLSAVDTLTEFGRSDPAKRELGLAYGELALRGNRLAAKEAARLLEEVLRDRPEDGEVLTRLGYLSQLQGDLTSAEKFYDRALKTAPEDGVVAANLGVLYASRGMLPRALALWRDAFDRNPQLTELGLNLRARLVHRRTGGRGPADREARARTQSRRGGCTNAVVGIEHQQLQELIRRMVLDSFPKLTRRRSRLHGFGVFAAEPINKNTRIIDYAGELIRNTDSADARGALSGAGLHLGLPRSTAPGAATPRSAATSRASSTTRARRTAGSRSSTRRSGFARRDDSGRRRADLRLRDYRRSDDPCRCRPGCKTWL